MEVETFQGEERNKSDRDLRQLSDYSMIRKSKMEQQKQKTKKTHADLSMGRSIISPCDTTSRRHDIRDEFPSESGPPRIHETWSEAQMRKSAMAMRHEDNVWAASSSLCCKEAHG